MKKQQEICLNIAINWTGSQSKMEKKGIGLKFPSLFVWLSGLNLVVSHLCLVVDTEQDESL